MCLWKLQLPHLKRPVLLQVVRIEKPYGDTPPEIPARDMNYHRDLMEQTPRQGLKPLHVAQPDGPSFTVRCTLHAPCQPPGPTCGLPQAADGVCQS